MKPTSDKPATSAIPQHLQQAIRRRAEEIYVRTGRVSGRDVENWKQAEQEILVEAEMPPGHAAIVVKVNGVQYVGEYQAEFSDGYVPGEIGPGSSVTVRLQGDKMFVKRPNGRELETRIVKRIGESR